MTTMTDVTYLEIKWTVSRGRETYGYNIVTLTDTVSGKRYRCNGGGYDMIGTVLGQWLQDVHQPALWEIRERAHSIVSVGNWTTNDSGLYGMRWTEDEVQLDGACGTDSMIRVAKAIGVSIRSTVDRKGHVSGYIVTSESAS